MHKIILSIVALCIIATVAVAQYTTAVTAPTGKPNFVIVDRLVVNLNAIAGIDFNAHADGNAGTVTITYLTGQTASYQVKMTANKWTDVQNQIITNGNK